MQQLQGSSSFTISDLNLIVMIKNQKNNKKKNLMFVSLKQLQKSTKNPQREKGFSSW